MPKIGKSLPFNELQTKPPLNPQITVTDEIQQTLSLLSAFDGGQRRLIRCSESGILQTVNPQHQLFKNIPPGLDDRNWQGDNIPISEVIVRAHPDNTDRVWVNVFAVADANIGWPLDGNEYIPLVITNLKYLHLNIILAADTVILEYTL